VRVNVSREARAVVSRVAVELGLTQRMVLDALLADRELVRGVAGRLAAGIRQSARLE
jgi:predicted transcriptional regulator